MIMMLFMYRHALETTLCPKWSDAKF